MMDNRTETQMEELPDATISASNTSVDFISDPLSNTENGERKSNIIIKSDLEMITFCVPLSGLSNKESGTEEAADGVAAPGATHGNNILLSANNKCVVGTITVMKRSSAFIWIGWGDCEQQYYNSQPQPNTTSRRSASSLPSMGPLVISMPRTNYIGNISSVSDPSCSQLIAGENVDDQMIGWQMASRLSLQLGWPILVACSLAATSASANISTTFASSAALEEYNTAASEASLMSHRAAAMGEKEICRILTQLIK